MLNNQRVSVSSLSCCLRVYPLGWSITRIILTGGGVGDPYFLCFSLLETSREIGKVPSPYISSDFWFSVYPKYISKVFIPCGVIIPSTASINRKDDHVSRPSNSISSSGKFLVSGIQQASNKAQRAKKAKSRKEPKPKVSSKTWFGGLNFIKPWNWFSQWINNHDKKMMS